MRPGYALAGSRSTFVALVAAFMALAAGCGSITGGTHLPWSAVERVGGVEDIDSTLAALEVRWEGEESPSDSGMSAAVAVSRPSIDAQRRALSESLEKIAARRGFRFGDARSSSRWILVRTPGAGPPGPGHPPFGPDGYPAALADRVRRSSSRAVPPTAATLHLRIRKHDVPVWSGEVRFDPEEHDPQGSAEAALRALVWQLPRFAAETPTFRRLAPSEIVPFYREQLGRALLCPVLPYPVRFPAVERAYLRGGAELQWDDTVNRYSHDDASVLPACLDLVQNAGLAVPASIPGYVDLAGVDLWSAATLFGTYRDENGRDVHVRIRLKGDTRGYDVQETRVLDEAEAASERAEQQEFAKRLQEYFEQRGR